MMTNQVDIDERLWELWKEAQKQANPKDAYASALEAEVLALFSRIAALEAAAEAVVKEHSIYGVYCPRCAQRNTNHAADCFVGITIAALAPAPEGTG